MKVTIHQPEHLPYLGFFDKIQKADKFVILDNVKFRKNYFQNRNKINGINGEQWITVPVHNNGDLIKDIKIDQVQWTRLREKNLRSIEYCYKKCDYFDAYYPDFKMLYKADHEKLITLNMQLLFYIVDKLGIKLDFIYASSLGSTGLKTDLLVDICNKVGATTYLSGKSGKDYIELGKFEIKVEYHEFTHPVYYQNGIKNFVPNMSVIDMLFNCGTLKK